MQWRPKFAVRSQSTKRTLSIVEIHVAWINVWNRFANHRKKPRFRLPESFGTGSPRVVENRVVATQAEARDSEGLPTTVK